MTTSPERRPFLVIGAGPVGLAVAKAFVEAGIVYDHVEATDHVGGNWAHGVYATAHIISSKRTTEYPDWPMPAHYPDFPSAAQMCAYYEAFTDAHGLRDRISFRTPVIRARYRHDRRWDVTFGDGSLRTYQGIVVCNGHHWAKSLPAWAEGFAGRVLHSKDYHDPDDLRGQKVLVVGGGNSGCDLISEAARVATDAHWSLRRGYWFLPKTLLGVPSPELLWGFVPVPIQRLVLSGLLRIAVGRYSDYGLPEPNHAMFEAHPSVSTEALHYLRHGRIRVRPDVVGVDGHRVTFADGSAEDFELVVCATGFDVVFPFLEEGAVPVVGKTPQLFGGVLRPELRHLYVVGAQQARYGIGPLVRPLARLVARWIALQEQLDVNLGEVLRAVGASPPTTHLVDPHAALRRMWLSEYVLEPVLLRVGRRMSTAAPVAAPA